MTNDIDIYRAANLYVDQYDDLATFEAGMRADAMLEAGDMEGAAVWRKVIKAIELMQATEPGGSLH